MSPWHRAILVDSAPALLAVYLAVSGRWNGPSGVDAWFDRLERVLFGRGMSRPVSWLQHTAIAVALSALSALASWSAEGYALAAFLVAVGYTIREADDLSKDALWWDSLVDMVGPWLNAYVALRLLA